MNATANNIAINLNNLLTNNLPSHVSVVDINIDGDSVGCLLSCGLVVEAYAASSHGDYAIQSYTYRDGVASAITKRPNLVSYKDVAYNMAQCALNFHGVA